MRPITLELTDDQWFQLVDDFDEQAAPDGRYHFCDSDLGFSSELGNYIMKVLEKSVLEDLTLALTSPSHRLRNLAERMAGVK